MSVSLFQAEEKSRAVHSGREIKQTSMFLSCFTDEVAHFAFLPCGSLFDLLHLCAVCRIPSCVLFLHIHCLMPTYCLHSLSNGAVPLSPLHVGGSSSNCVILVVVCASLCCLRNVGTVGLLSRVHASSPSPKACASTSRSPDFWRRNSTSR